MVNGIIERTDIGLYPYNSTLFLSYGDDVQKTSDYLDSLYHNEDDYLCVQSIENEFIYYCSDIIIDMQNGIVASRDNLHCVVNGGTSYCFEDD